MKKTIRIMLVEDSPEYRDVIEFALADEPDMNLVSKFGAAEVALRHMEDLSTRKKTDIILLDINLPGMSGVEAIPRIKALNPDAKIIMLTQSNMEADVIRSIQFGAAGYLLKSSSLEEIIQGIRTVLQGGAPLDAGVAKYILNALSSRHKTTQIKKPHTSKIKTKLSKRETETLTLLSEGFSRKQIADQLGISDYTVDEYIKQVYHKLNAQNAPQAISKAYRSGILPAG
jgi:DNA-binding NarL/FixJ family response regulator